MTGNSRIHQAEPYSNQSINPPEWVSELIDHTTATWDLGDWRKHAYQLTSLLLDKFHYVHQTLWILGPGTLRKTETTPCALRIE